MHSRYCSVFFSIYSHKFQIEREKRKYLHKMYQQYVYQAQSAIAYLSTDELKELINDDEKLEERVMDVVSVALSILISLLPLRECSESV